MPAITHVTSNKQKGLLLNLFERIYNLSLYKFRLISLVLITIGVYLVTLGILNISKVILEQVFIKPEIDGGSVISDEKLEDKSIGEGISTNIPEEIKDAGKTVSSVKTTAEIARMESLKKTNEIGVWVATDYKDGDIGKGNYTVVKGDTLWEISEAVYGNGANWSQILAANSSSIGFLANGSQALIVPGQVLVIP